MIPYSTQNKIDVINCHSTGKYCKDGYCLYTTQTDCKYRIKVTGEYQANPLRIWTYEVYTEEFNIIK